MLGKAHGLDEIQEIREGNYKDKSRERNSLSNNRKQISQ